MYSKYKIIRGGIGDILQSIPFVLENKSLEYIVITHCSKAFEIFKNLQVENIQYIYFKDLNSLKNAELKLFEYLKLNFSEAELCPRSLYFQKYPFDDDLAAPNFEKNNKPIIGIHPFGSEFSNNVYIKTLGKFSKNIDMSVIESIICDNFNYFIFGLDHELSEFKLREMDNIKYIKYDNILHSLNSVKYCDKFISSDSGFKTMSSMLKIKTYCLIPDIQDQFRDDNFIYPYVKDKVMNVYKFNDTAKEKEEIIKFINF